MHPREIVVVFNNTAKKIHSVHVENANAIKERFLISGQYPMRSYMCISLEEAEQSIRNNAAISAADAYYGMSD